MLSRTNVERIAPLYNTANANHMESWLGFFRYFPQPLFMINRDMELIDKNIEAKLALEKNWVSKIANKLHFNSKSNNTIVSNFLERITSGKSFSERFVLPCIDMEFHAYTLSCVPSASDAFLLNIQHDCVNSSLRLEALTQAYSLTPSEGKVLGHMVEGLKPKQIAHEAGISLNTVRSHLRTLYAKMSVRDYNEALIQAVRLLG